MGDDFRHAAYKSEINDTLSFYLAKSAGWSVAVHHRWMSPVKGWGEPLTCSHTGLLSLTSSTWTSTTTTASNFPSVAMTLRVYLSLASLSRGSFTIRAQPPSPHWMTANWPRGSPSARMIEDRVMKLRRRTEAFRKNS